MPTFAYKAHGHEVVASGAGDRLCRQAAGAAST